MHEMLILVKFLQQHFISFGTNNSSDKVLNMKHLIIYIFVNGTPRTDVECSSTFKYIKENTV